MHIKLSEAAIEQSTYAIIVSFFDDDSIAVAPDVGSLTWSLSDTNGNIINSRDDVAASSATVVTIVLSGDDLGLTNSRTATRILTVKCTYTSSLGSNLPLRDDVYFTVTGRVIP